MRAFVDTNPWVYRLDQREPDKSKRVGAWLRQLAEDNELVVNAQVLIELRPVLTRRLTPALSHADTLRALSAVASFEVVATDHDLVLDAHQGAARAALLGRCPHCRSRHKQRLHGSLQRGSDPRPTVRRSAHLQSAAGGWHMKRLAERRPGIRMCIAGSPFVARCAVPLTVAENP